MSAETAEKLGDHMSQLKPLPKHPWETDPESVLKNIAERQKTLMLSPDEKAIEPEDIIPFRLSK